MYIQLNGENMKKWRLVFLIMQFTFYMQFLTLETYGQTLSDAFDFIKKGDEKNAISILIPLADAGNFNAASYLAIIYGNDKSPYYNRSEECRLHGIAARQNVAFSIYFYAHCYYFDGYYGQDNMKATYWLEKLIALENENMPTGIKELIRRAKIQKNEISSHLTEKEMFELAKLLKCFTKNGKDCI